MIRDTNHTKPAKPNLFASYIIGGLLRTHHGAVNGVSSLVQVLNVRAHKQGDKSFNSSETVDPNSLVIFFCLIKDKTSIWDEFL